MHGAWLSTVLVAAATLLCSCGAGVTMQPPPPAARGPSAEKPNALAQLLERYVDLDGRVDYASWNRSFTDVTALDTYTRDLMAHAPEEHPKLYRTEADRLAYWLNLYNALALREVLARWPVDRLDDRAMLHDLRFEIGGQSMSLTDIEMRIIRATFADPRAHFAISCGAMSCALLPRTPFEGVALDERLDEATRVYVNRRDNVSVDDDRKRVLLSPLFGWYERDLVRVVKTKSQHPAPTILDFVRLYAAPDLAEALLRARRGRYRVELMPYDWRVNDIASLPISEGVTTDVDLSTEPIALPDMDLELLDGTRVKTEDLEGKVVVLDFWATWCRPCLWSFPRYAQLLVTHEKRGLQVVAVAQDESRAPVDAFAKANHVAVDVALDPTRLSSKPPLSVATLPTVIVVDRAGMIRYRLEGYDASKHSALEAAIEGLLEDKTP